MGGDELLTFTYRNWRGEVSTRTVHPIGISFGSTEWHPEPQWLLHAFDMEKRAARDFAMRDIGVDRAAVLEEAAKVAEGFGSEPAPANDGRGTRVLQAVDGHQIASAIRALPDAGQPKEGE